MDCRNFPLLNKSAMPRHIFILLLLALMSFSAQAQLGLQLYRSLPDLDPNEVVPLFVEGDTKMIASQISEFEGHFKYAYGDIAAIRMPVHAIERFAIEPYVTYVERPVAPPHLLDDMSAMHINVDSVWQGLGDLSRAFTGKDVVIGFLDSGMDFNHPDFTNEDSTTRVMHIWDQTRPTGSNTPPQYGYGQEWDSTGIQDGLSTHSDANSHGTKVTGIASGNGRMDSTYTGVAPESDIIMVEIAFNSDFLSNVADGIDFILRKAKDAGKPAVINGSLGTYFGSHDGLDITARLIDNMLLDEPGRVMVCAAGNAGNNRFHLGYDLSADTNFTWFSFYNQLGFAYFQFYADTNRFGNAYFSIGANRPSDWSEADETPWLNLKEDFTYVNDLAFRAFDLYNDSSQRLAQIELYVERSQGRYTVDVVVAPDTNNLLFSFQTTGEGRFDSWSSTSLTGTSNFRGNNLPDTNAYPPIKYYKGPDAANTTVSSWACSPNVITVGSFVNRNSWPNYRGDTTTRSGIVSDFHPASSVGYSRIGVVKPDVVAPGQLILTTSTLSQLNTLRSARPQDVAPSGWHSIFNGTSAACPLVAGVVALFLEQYPESPTEEVITAIHALAREDSFTGYALPDSAWGYGKIDAYQLLTVTRGCMDTAALNYDPNAILPGDTCMYPPPVGLSAIEDGTITVVPNPMVQSATISWPEHWQLTYWSLTDMMGRMVQSGQVVAAQQVIHRGELAKGLYFVSLYGVDQRIFTAPIIIP